MQTIDWGQHERELDRTGSTYIELRGSEGKVLYAASAYARATRIVVKETNRIGGPRWFASVENAMAYLREQVQTARRAA